MALFVTFCHLLSLFVTFCHPVLKTAFFAQRGQGGGVFNFMLLVFSWDGSREDREGGEDKPESIFNHEIHQLHEIKLISKS